MDTQLADVNLNQVIWLLACLYPALLFLWESLFTIYNTVLSALRTCNLVHYLSAKSNQDGPYLNEPASASEASDCPGTSSHTVHSHMSSSHYEASCRRHKNTKYHTRGPNTSNVNLEFLQGSCISKIVASPKYMEDSFF